MADNLAERAEGTPVFVVGSGRCGSTQISKILRSHPDVLSVSEFFTCLGRAEAFRQGLISPDEFLTILSTPSREATFLHQHGVPLPNVLTKPGRDDPRWLKGVPPLLLITLPFLTARPDELWEEVRSFAAARPPDLLSNHYETLLSYLTRTLGRSIWVERSGGSLMYLQELLKFWPHARYVHLHRDGRDCAFSMSKHHIYRVLVFTLRGGDPMEYVRRPSLEIPVDEFGKLWSWMVVRRARLLSRLPRDRVLQMRYEDLVARPSAEISRLMEFIGSYSPDANWLESAARSMNHVDPKWTSLPVKDRRLLERACTPGLRALGYR